MSGQKSGSHTLTIDLFDKRTEVKLKRKHTVKVTRKVSLKIDVCWPGRPRPR